MMDKLSVVRPDLYRWKLLKAKNLNKLFEGQILGRIDIYHHKDKDSPAKQKAVKCARCGGTGKVHNSNSIFDMTCPTCGGKGWNAAPA